MTIKKLSLSIALAVTAGLAASSTSAYVVGIPSSGVLVPMAFHSGPGDTTAVGLTNHADVGTGDIVVYWSFYNQNSLKQIDGEFKMTPNDRYTFVLAEKAPNFASQRGYLTFAVGNRAGVPIGASISAEAFQANITDGDAEFIPTFPISTLDWRADTNLFAIGVNDLQLLLSGAHSIDDNLNLDDMTATFDLRYAQDADFDSEIVIWATGGLRNENGWPVQIFNDDQQRVSGRMPCPTTEVCRVQVNSENLPAKPAAFTNGFIRFDLPAGAVRQDWDPDLSITSAVSYTRVSSQTFGAVQTILNTHYADPVDFLGLEPLWTANFIDNNDAAAVLQGLR